MDILMYILAIYGLGMICWLIGASSKSAVGSLSGTYIPDDKPLSIQRESKDGRFRVRKAGYNEHLKLYYADIERTGDREYMNTVVGASQKDMEDWLIKELERLSLKRD